MPLKAYFIIIVSNYEGLQRIHKTCSYLNLSCTSQSGKFIVDDSNCPSVSIPMIPTDDQLRAEHNGELPAKKNRLSFVRNVTQAEVYFTTDHICPV